MKPTVVICHYGAGSLLRACLAALWAATEIPFELEVVDNNLTGGSFAQGCNVGARETRGDPIVFLNNDTEPHAGWLEPLIAAAEGTTGIVGAKLLYPNGLVQHAGVDLYMSRGVLTAAHSPVGMADVRRFVPAVTGACMAVRRACWDDVGGFDEGFINGYEDVDFALQAGALGWSVLYEPASVVMHHESASGPARWTHVSANVQRLQDKWAGKVSA